MARKKLTLSVEEDLTERAKSIADDRGTSVSRLVETFFSVLRNRGEDEDDVHREKDGERSDRAFNEHGDDTPGESSREYDPSDWAKRWRGAFRSEEDSYPDDVAWEENVIAEMIEEKHN